MKLNLGGCETVEGGPGSAPLAGFTNVDCRKMPGVDVVADVRKLPYANATVDEIRASHIIEHFALEEIPRVLAEWRRVLKAYGLLRIYCPNTDALVDSYVNKRIGLEQFSRWLFGDQDYPENLHRIALNPGRLETLVWRAGFYITGLSPRPNAYPYDMGIQAVKR